MSKKERMLQMKKLSLLLALLLALSGLGLSSLAEEAAQTAEDPAKEIYIIPAEGEQIELGYVEGTTILEVDGLKFKDLNKNGELDVYEDWREADDARIADLLSQMTQQEKASMLIQTDMPRQVGGEGAEDPETIWYYVTEYGITHMLDNNHNGTPDYMATVHNSAQQAAESARLGIPVTVTSDRQYNAWSGYIDTAHDAIGTANDIDLATEILAMYAKESAATGIHVTLQPYGVEIGSWYGEDPAYLAEMTAAEVEAYQQNGVFTCVKHFIARGGDDSFEAAQSVAQNVENYMYPWKAAIDAGTKWIMTNSAGSGLDELNVDFSAKTMGYLRDTLGFDGVVVTDWGSIGYAAVGIAEDGTDLALLDNKSRFAWEINNGVDQLGINNVTLNSEEASGSCYNIMDMLAAVEEELIPAERVDEACGRLLRTKFELGLFEEPYVDPQEALALAASEEYIASPWEIIDTESLAAARNQELVELERQLQARSAVLVKNDEDLLPLSSEVKVFIGSTNGTAIGSYKEHISSYATVVEDITQADVVIADCTRIDDSAELLIEDALLAEKKLVVVANCVDPDTWIMETADAVLFLNFTRVPDHGTALDGFITTTEPIVFAELLFGVRQPEGMIVKEIARDAEMDNTQWKDLAGDQGASMDVRMLIQALMLSSETHSTPNNYGDPLLAYQYGMRYGQSGEFAFSTLVLPTELQEVEVHLFLDVYDTQNVSVNKVQRSGEPFTVYCIVWNHGDDDVLNVQVKDGEAVVAEKLMAVHGGSWRVFKTDITLEGAGEHVLSIGDLSTVVTVEE